MHFLIWGLEGGWTLERHWNSDETLEKIRQGTWDVVVLQGHSQETSNQQDVICTDRDSLQLTRFTDRLNEEIETAT